MSSTPTGETSGRFPNIIGTYLYFIGDVAYYCMFLAPSFVFVLIYVPVYILAIGYVSIRWGDFDDTDFIGLMAQMLVFGVLSSIGLFYILQRRELKRFFQYSVAS